MKQLNMETAVKRYNNIMYSVCREYLTIGTSFSEHTGGWNLRDMVSEMQYTLDIYDDPDCIYWQDAHDESQHWSKPWYKEWVSEKGKMKRFIEAYEPFITDMICTQGHCSKYD